MEQIYIKPTEHTPRIVLSAENIYEGISIEISGESVPEDSKKFYTPVFDWLNDLSAYIGKDSYATGKGINITLNFRMEYFNSSSAKVFIMIMENCFEIKNKFPELKIVINWMYNDEDVMEAGEEFKSLVSVPFNILRNHLIISGTKNSPSIRIDPDKKIFEISGNSFMENAPEFYFPVFEWITQYGGQYFKRDFIFDFKLKYFNTSSAKVFSVMFKKLDNLHSVENVLTINWFYDDEDNKEENEDFAKTVKLPFRFIKTEDEVA